MILFQRFFLVTTVCVAFLTSQAEAQLNRYWANNFSEEAALLSGAVVGGGAGASAVFYNPAIVAQIRDSRFTLNADVLTFETYRWENALGERQTLKSFSPKIAPSFFALLIKPNNKRITYEVSILTREETEFDLAFDQKTTRDILSSFEGEEIFDVHLETKSRFTNLWMGFGGAYEIKDNFSLGASGWLVAKSLSDNFNLDLNAFPTSNPVGPGGELAPFQVSNFTNRYRIKSFNLRMLAKIGAFWNYRRWGFGLNLTLPSINLLGNGDVSGRLSYTNIPDSTGAVRPDFILVDAQRKVPVNYKDPTSIAVGARYTTASERTNFHLTFEYFLPISIYKSVDAEINPLMTNEETFDTLRNQDFLSEYTGAERILNAAFGFKQVLSPVVNLLMGFRTDFNYLSNLDFSEVHPFNRPAREAAIDVLHISGGTQINIGGSRLVLGLQWSGGSDQGKMQLGNTSPEQDDMIDPPLQGPIRNDLNVFYRSLSVIFGIDLDISGG